MICEQCGQGAGPAMNNCPERASGNCPYKYQQDRPNLWRRFKGVLLVVAGLLAFGLALVAIWFVLGNPGAVLNSGGSGAALFLFGFLFAVFVLGLALGFVGVYFAFGKRETLHNPITGAMWQRSNLFNVEI